MNAKPLPAIHGLNAAYTKVHATIGRVTASVGMLKRVAGLTEEHGPDDRSTLIEMPTIEFLEYVESLKRDVDSLRGQVNELTNLATGTREGA